MTDTILEALATEATAFQKDAARAANITATVEREHAAKPTVDTAARLDNARSAQARADLAAKHATDALEQRRAHLKRQADERAALERAEGERTILTAAEREAIKERERKAARYDDIINRLNTFPEVAAAEIDATVEAFLAAEHAWKAVHQKVFEQNAILDEVRGLARELGHDPSINLRYYEPEIGRIVRRKVVDAGRAAGIEIVFGDMWGGLTAGLGRVGRS